TTLARIEFFRKNSAESPTPGGLRCRDAQGRGSEKRGARDGPVFALREGELLQQLLVSEVRDGFNKLVRPVGETGKVFPARAAAEDQDRYEEMESLPAS